jgi:hypothetical protein
VTKRARGIQRVMALATRVECDKESDGFGGKSDGNEGGRRLAARAMATATATTWVVVMRLAGDDEVKGEGGKGDGDGDEGVAGNEEAMVTAARAMAAATMVAGE